MATRRGHWKQSRASDEPDKSDSWPFGISDLPTAEADRSATPAVLEFARIWRDQPKIVFSG